MKIICVGRNYSEHAKELKNEVPDKPVIFMKPDTALLRGNAPFFLPDWSQDVHHEVEVVFRISKNGKYIRPEFAHKYVEEISLGIDFTARDLQAELKGKGLPWELAKAFDGSAVIGDMLKLSDLSSTDAISFRLEKNGETVQQGNTSDMLFHWKEIIAFVSQYFTLRQGDLIYTGTPAGVSRVQPGDNLVGYLEDRQLFSCAVK